jgi:hypothetical protein
MCIAIITGKPTSSTIETNPFTTNRLIMVWAGYQ